MLNRFDNIIFDIDGTLVDSSRDIIKCLKNAYKTVLNKEFVLEENLIGPPLKEIIKFATPNVNEEEINLLIKNFRAKYFNINYEKTLLYDNAKQFICKLKDKNLYVVTNKPAIPTKKILKKFSIYENFKDIITPDFLPNKEFNKIEMLAYLIDKDKIKKNKTLMIGDTVADIVASHKNGIEILCLLHGYGKENELKESGANYIAKNFTCVIENCHIIDDSVDLVNFCESGISNIVSIVK